MILKIICYTLSIFILFSSLQAGSHEEKIVQEDFSTAIKHVEKKNYFEAFKIFSGLAELGVPEAQYNLALLYSNGLGVPINYKLTLYWSWQSHLNGHQAAMRQVTNTYDLINENLRNEVAQLIIDELLENAYAGDQVSPLKLGKTYLGLFVEAQNQPAYLWLSISQAYGDVAASKLLDVAATQLTLEEVLSQQEQAQKIFDEIISDD